MSGGRPRKPENIRQRTHQLPSLRILPGANEKLEIPRAPNGLLPSSRRLWKEFWLSSIAKAVDVHADLFKLTRWIGAVDEWTHCGEVFRKARLVKGSTGQPTLNPLGTYLVSLEAQISRIETEFGMGPLSRMRLGLATGQAALTAEELNRRLDVAQDPADVQIVDVELSEWEQA